MRRALFIACAALALAAPAGADVIGDTEWGRTFVNLIASSDPAPIIVSIDFGAQQTFEVQCYNDDTTDVAGEWFLDGAKQESGTKGEWEEGRTFKVALGPEELYPIRRELRFVATDKKPKQIFTADGVKEVKRTPEQKSWVVLVRPPDQLPKLRVVRTSFLE